MRALIVEDEIRLAEAVAQNLRRHNLETDISLDGKDGLHKAFSGVYDVVLLDIMLPKKDGLSVLSELRAEGVQTPVILLTALGEVEDRVRGLNCGADDYLPKPFSTEELIARIMAVTRRRGASRQYGLLTYGDIEFNPQSLMLSRAGKSFALTQKESRLLEVLIEHKDVRMGTDFIIEKVWGYDSDVDWGNVQAYMSFLRKKLAALGSRVRIGNIRGSGYMLEYDGE